MAEAALRVPGRERLVRDTAHLAARTVLQQILGFVRGLILPNLLGPFHYGALSTVLLVERYSSYANLGIQMATLYRAPGMIANGLTAEARKVHDDVVSFSVLTGALAGGLVVVGALWFRDRLAPEITTGLLVAAFLPPLIVLRGAVMTWARANLDFAAVSRGGMLHASVLFVLALALGWLWQSVGAVAAHVLAYATLVAYLARRTRTVRLLPPSRRIVDLLRFSTPIATLSVITIYLMSVDRLVIAALLPVEEVGFYAIGQALAGLLLLIPGAFGEAVGPSLIADPQIGRSGSPSSLEAVTRVMSVALAIVAGCLIAALPGVIELAFPQYRAAIPAAQVLCVVAYFESIGVGAHYIVTSRGNVRSYILYISVLALVAAVVLPVACRAFGITGVAGMVIVLTALRTLWLAWTSRRLAGASRSAVGEEIATYVLIGVMVAAVPLAVQSLLGPATGLQPVSIAATAVMRVLATLAVLLLLAALFAPSQLRSAISAAAAFLRLPAGRQIR